MAKDKKGNRDRITIVILENRQMIASILADLLEGSGYSTQMVSRVGEAREILPEHVPAFLLADVGMLPPDRLDDWRSLEEVATTLGVPVFPFSCGPMPEEEGIMILRSPSDFATVLAKVEEELHKKQPYLGMTLVGMGQLSQQELETVLRIQSELVHIGRQHSLGDLLVRLGFIGQEELDEALRKQES